MFYKNCDKTEGVSTKTGYGLISNESEFCWSHQCVQNAIYGMYHRQLACNLYPDVDSVANFTREIVPWFLESCKKVDVKLRELTKFDPYAIVSEKNFERGKKMRYVDNLRRLLSGMKQAKGCFTSMVKSGETYYTK